MERPSSGKNKTLKAILVGFGRFRASLYGQPVLALGGPVFVKRLGIQNLLNRNIPFQRPNNLCPRIHQVQ